MEQNRTTIKEVIKYLDQEIPRSLQESYDNCGLQVESLTEELTGVLLAVDITEDVIQEAIDTKCNLIVTHHPLLFKGLKQISRRTYIERAVRKAIKHDIAIYSAHTNLDNLRGGVNYHWADMMGLQNCKAIMPLEQSMFKLVIYSPISHADSIRTVLRDNAIGIQGDYDGCSFTVKGEGRFRALDGASPHVGNVGEWHTEPEEAIYTMCHKHDLSKAMSLIKSVHPYEEPVIDVIPMHHNDPAFGAGIIGDLPQPVSVPELFEKIKALLPVHVIAHSKILKENVKRIAYCGGSGAFLRRAAAASGADIFITGEAKYNDYYDAVDDVTLATIGHYESEELT
ncbi:MAG: Nif3-like dinuclear metal center hexameric protein, partial [Porphyromonas sp.]|nr:Nif3-like dinuclear metal center hexameric protein [Porphyromonas sp.]